jgi:hypothetical protein
MKRQRSNQSDGSAEKRQRISREPDTSAELDFATLLARATATAHQEVAKAQGNGIGPAETVHPYTSLDNGQRSDAYTFDPQLHMRILSLPILESLVRELRHCSWEIRLAFKQMLIFCSLSRFLQLLHQETITRLLTLSLVRSRNMGKHMLL